MKWDVTATLRHRAEGGNCFEYYATVEGDDEMSARDAYWDEHDADKYLMVGFTVKPRAQCRRTP